MALIEKLGKISNDTVMQATGKEWKEWVEIIDNEGGATMTHKEIARMLFEKKYIESGWWCQSVTVGYEYAKGRRVVGETKDAGFEVGAQKVVYQPVEKVWNFLLSPKGLHLWLGNISTLELKEKSPYETKDGTTGEIRRIKEGQRIRMTWQPNGWKSPATLHFMLTCPRNTKEKTNIGFHLEKLPNAKTREHMRNHWQLVLEKIAKELS